MIYEPAFDTTPPAMPTGFVIDIPPSRPGGLKIEEV